ncbi:hypothetical protein SAMN05660477_02262 [Soonwooa buanensis]|uniref:Uncharacterized protein n=1 Tax=Soonwooa buanensis TaxID=619805 RepID=A0A1T5FTV0_9FLAO|nr:hypothetical protein [Soonwooa buanensis]SKB99494.1 hypothetical protein SAMN05660477_02262 [Soonwooa buanensis]
MKLKLKQFFLNSGRDKIVLFSSVVALAFVLFYYSEFENKGIAYVAILVCLVFISFSFAKIKSPTDKIDEYQLVEDRNNELEDFDGIFKYNKYGFSFIEEDSQEYVKWSEIVEVNAFSIRFFENTKQSGYEIITAQKTYKLDAESAGVYKLTNQLADNLPTWKMDSPFNKINNGIEKANLYKKED